ncbi:mechanosensitive ion channel family protein [Rhodobacterales bacterium]|nr:mechanosensitive ion channel family protein [Rhodobacterales bacterium]
MEPLNIIYGQFNEIIRHTIALAPNFLSGSIVLILTWIVALILGRVSLMILRRSRSRPSLQVALVKVTHLSVWLLGGMIALTILFPNLTPTKLLAGLGIGSIAIGLAFKDIFENFLAGFLILLRKPMRIGDDIECNDLSGRVENISIRDTFLRKRSGELFLVPNSYLYKNPVKILTDRHLRRISLVVGVAYGENAAAAQEVISKTVEALETRDKSKPFDVFAKEFGSSSIDFLVRWWTESPPRQEHASRSEAVISIKAALDREGIEIPFPYRTLTFAEPMRVVTEPGGSDEDAEDTDQKTDPETGS